MILAPLKVVLKKGILGELAAQGGVNVRTNSG